MTFNVNTFRMGGIDTSVDKVVEEANEVKEAYENYRDSRTKEEAFANMCALQSEIGDVVTAVANLCDKMHIDAQRCIDIAETKNVIRGYYKFDEEFREKYPNATMDS